jgi:hypothetical protein
MKTYASGTLIANRYEIASRPMMGGMGIVYICLDRQEDHPVVLKTFKPEYLPDRAARDRFLREGHAWISLGRHLHVVRCYEVRRTDDGLEVYLALELIAKALGYPDASLRSWLIPGQPLPVETAPLYALQGGAVGSSGPSSDQILQQFGPVIEAVVAATHGHAQSHAAVEAAFDQFERGNWRIVEPIQRIWQGERNEAALTAGIDANSALIVREILRQLEE